MDEPFFAEDIHQWEGLLSTSITPVSAQWNAPLKDLGVTTITNSNTCGADHLSFDAVSVHGVAATTFLQRACPLETCSAAVNSLRFSPSK
jgi:hypothetical protein